MPDFPVLAQVGGVGIHVANMSGAVAAIASAIEGGTAFRLFTLNLDHLVKLRRDSGFGDIYARADIVTADGAPVAHLARRQGRSIERVTGADLIFPVCELAALRGWPIYLYGTSNAVLARASQRLCERFPTLRIAGMMSPPMGFDVAAAAKAMPALMAAAGARLCLVALGAPKQELFSDRAALTGVPMGYLAIGAGLDFIAGAVARAPRIMQQTGTEWIFRLLSEPGRLTKRYALCAVEYFRLRLM